MIAVNDEVGIVADISQTLADQGINIESISVEGWGDRGVVILTTDQYDTAMKALRDAEFEIITYDAMVLKLRDEPGSLAKVAGKLRDAKINIQSLHVLDSSNGYTRIAFAVDDREGAEELLEIDEEA